MFIYDRHQEVHVTSGGTQNSKSENRHDITEILLKVAYKRHNPPPRLPPPKSEILFFITFSLLLGSL